MLTNRGKEKGGSSFLEQKMGDLYSEDVLKGRRREKPLWGLQAGTKTME